MTSPQFSEGQTVPQPLQGRKQLLPNLVDGIAQTRPESTYARIPRTPTTWRDGTRKITYRLLANAVNGMGHYILKKFGQPAAEENCFAYFGVWDPRFAILTIAAIKSGYKVLFPSAAQSVDGLLHLLSRVKCTRIMTATRALPILQSLEQSGTELEVVDAPGLEQLFDIQHPHLAYTKTFEEAKKDEFLIMHTSGSTGPPKPLVYSNDWAASFITLNQSTPPAGFESEEYRVHGTDILSFGPPSHASALLGVVLAPLANSMTVLFPTENATLSVESLMETLQDYEVDVLFCPSILLEAAAVRPDLLELLKARVRIIGSGAGPLSQRAGRLLSQHIHLVAQYGTSENGTQTKLSVPGTLGPDSWNYTHFHPNDGVEMRPLAEGSDQYEAVVVRNRSADLEQPVFKMFPELQEWSTKDIFVGHPAPEFGEDFRFYTYSHRRTDNLTLLINDDQQTVLRVQTICPLPYEQHLSGVGHIQSALVIGDRRPFFGLLIELAPGGEIVPGEHVKDKLWQQVQDCNELHGLRIERSHIIFTHPSRPLPRALKGTVQRAPANLLYQDEIATMYQSELGSKAVVAA